MFFQMRKPDGLKRTGNCGVSAEITRPLWSRKRRPNGSRPMATVMLPVVKEYGSEKVTLGATNPVSLTTAKERSGGKVPLGA